MSNLGTFIFQSRFPSYSDNFMLGSFSVRMYTAVMFSNGYDIRGLVLTFTRKLSNLEFQVVWLESSLRELFERNHELVESYRISVTQMISDMF